MEVTMVSWKRGRVLALLAGCCAVAQAFAEPEHGNIVVRWNAIAQNAIVTVAAQPIQRSQLWITLMHAAIYDAVMSINGDYEPFKVTPARLRPASREAAAIAAAHGVLVRLLPAQRETLDAAREDSLAAIRDGIAKDNGIAIGEEVAFALLQIHDGVIPVVSYTPGAGAGVWQPTPPAFANALLPGFAQVTPLALVNASQFLPGPPPGLLSDEWTRDYNEVKAYGVATGSLRSADQTETGLFYTEHAVAQYSRAFRRYATNNRLGIREAARFFAMTNTAILDAQIACWDAKFHYNFWRPVTAIRAGALDGNPLTEPDPTWIGLAATPAHPEYPAAHGCWTSATARILEHFNGTKSVDFALDSAVTGTTHVFTKTDDLRAEIINARVYGGMHYRNSVEVGAALGEQVADWVAANYFRRVADENDDQDNVWRRARITCSRCPSCCYTRSHHPRSGEYSHLAPLRQIRP
jgi:PAP2 superfamily